MGDHGQLWGPVHSTRPAEALPGTRCATRGDDRARAPCDADAGGVAVALLGALCGDSEPLGDAHGLSLRGFVVRFVRVEIHPSALRHGVGAEDIVHAVDHSRAVEDLGDDPDRWLVLGPDRSGNLLEVVVLVTVEGDELAIHAMAMRAKYRRLLEQ